MWAGKLFCFGTKSLLGIVTSIPNRRGFGRVVKVSVRAPSRETGSRSRRDWAARGRLADVCRTLIGVGTERFHSPPDLYKSLSNIPCLINLSAARATSFRQRAIVPRWPSSLVRNADECTGEFLYPTHNLQAHLSRNHCFLALLSSLKGQIEAGIATAQCVHYKVTPKQIAVQVLECTMMRVIDRHSVADWWKDNFSEGGSASRFAWVGVTGRGRRHFTKQFPTIRR